MGTRTALYVRISRDDDGTGLGVQRQEDDCRALAAELGVTIVDVYADNSVSAYSGKVRPNYRRMLDDIEAGLIDLVIAWHPDRLHRSPVELIEFIDACRAHDVGVRTVKAGQWDPSPAGRAVAITLAAWAEYESGHKSERIKRKVIELAQAGKVGGGGSRPFGYEKDRRTVVESEAAIIREVMQRALAGESLPGLCRYLNALGTTTTNGHEWTGQTLKRMLCSARIAGWREHTPGRKGRPLLGGEFIAPAEWPAIVSREDVETFRAVMRSPKRRRSGPLARHLLSGIMVCGNCQTPMNGMSRGQWGNRVYRCIRHVDGRTNTGCGHCQVTGGFADEVITDALCETLNSPAFIDAVNRVSNDDTNAKVRHQIEQDEARSAELADLYADGLITTEEWMRVRERLQERLEESRRSVTPRQPLMALSGLVGTGRDAFMEVWENANIDKRRAVATQLIERVVCRPGAKGRNTFDERRFVVEWRY